MNEVKLPMMAMSTGLDSALTRLRRSKRAGLLSKEEGRYHLFSAASIVVGRARGVKTLSELVDHPKLKPRVVPTHVSVPIGKARGKLSPPGSRGVKKTAPTRSVETRADFSLRQILGESALLSIRSASVAARFVASPSDCYCDGPRHHSFPPPEVAVGSACPRCGHTVICST